MASTTRNSSEYQAARTFVDDLGAYVSASPSSYHAVAEGAARLAAAGFRALDELQSWELTPGGYFVVRDGALMAWVIPTAATGSSAFRVFGTHTDSPGFKLKPKPTTGTEGWLQAGVEIYGGPLLNSWLDRELRLAGRLVLRDGSTRLCATGPFLRFPQLAVHLDREQMDRLNLDHQRHMNPVWGQGDLKDADLLAELAHCAGVGAQDIAGYDVVVADTQEPRVFGAREEFFASGRLDNLISTHAALVALAEAGTELEGNAIAFVAAFDHEELGSQTRSGASGPVLEDMLRRISAALGGDESDYRIALAGSLCVSADVGHAVHPNYPEKHDPANRPVLNGGPLLKINATQRYATDAEGAAAWANICASAQVPYQEFVSNNSIRCGSTIGPLTATRLGIRTVDVGVPVLSMHSAREMCGVLDPLRLRQAATAFFEGRY